MRAIICALLLVIVCCRGDNTSVNPKVFQGTWNAAPAGADVANRWTFDADELQLMVDSSGTCQKASSQPWKFWLDEDMLMARYAGISNGFFLIPDLKFKVVSSSDDTVVLLDDQQHRVELTRCK